MPGTRRDLFRQLKGPSQEPRRELLERLLLEVRMVEAQRWALRIGASADVVTRLPRIEGVTDGEGWPVPLRCERSRDMQPTEERDTKVKAVAVRPHFNGMRELWQFRSLKHASAF